MWSKEKCKEYQRKYRKNHLSKARKYDEEYQKNNKNKIKKYKKEYNKEYWKEYYKNNKGRIRVSVEEWRKKNRKRYNEKRRISHSKTGYCKKLVAKFHSYKSGAKTRKLLFCLTKNDFTFFWQKPCYYCGCKIETIGLDRKNSKIGYVIENVIPCCFDCNWMKMTKSVDEFVNKCKIIANRF